MSRANLRKSESARSLAAAVLDRVDETGAFAEPMINSCLESHQLADGDRRLLTAVVYGTLRMRGRLDWIILSLYRGDFSSMDTGILNILRSGLYQMLFLERIPDYAAVDEAVMMARARFPGREKLVNAILRSAQREADKIVYPNRETDPAGYISAYYSHPQWLVRKWLERLGSEETAMFCAANNSIPPVTLRVNRLQADRTAVLEGLLSAGINAEPARLSPDAINISALGVSPRSLPQVKSGVVHVQDEASQLVSALAGPRQGDSVLDLCAGTGGKTTHLAEIMRNKGRILAVDISPRKLQYLKLLAEAEGVGIVEHRAADAAEEIDEKLHGIFDLVFIDAPCSGTGTLRRNPEIKWRLTSHDVEKLVVLQKRILERAPVYLNDGGCIYYATCSTLIEENESIIDGFLVENPLFMLQTPDFPHKEIFDQRGFFRTWPHRTNTDGFFGARLVKNQR